MQNGRSRALGSLGSGKNLLDPVLALLDVELLPAPTLLLDLLDLLGEGRIGTDGGVGLLVNFRDLVGLNSVLDELAKAGVVLPSISLLEGLLVISNVLTEDALLQNLGLELLGLSVVAGEPPLTVGDLKATIDGTLEGGEDLGSGGRAVETHIEVAGERAGRVIDVLNVVDLSVDFLVANVLGVQLELLEETAGGKETHAVGGGIVGQTGLDSVPGELVRVGGGEDVITVDLGKGHLGDDVGVGDTDNEAVLGAVVLVLVLGNEPLAGTVIGLTLTPAPVLDLEALEVSLVLHKLDENLSWWGKKKRKSDIADESILFPFFAFVPQIAVPKEREWRDQLTIAAVVCGRKREKREREGLF